MDTAATTMPITNDNESQLTPKEDTNATIPIEPVLDLVAVLDSGASRTCAKCGKALQAFRYQGIYGWSHVEKRGCIPHEEDWDAWSLRWVPVFRQTCGDVCGPELPYRSPGEGGGGSGHALLRRMSPTKLEDITGLELAHDWKCVWIWESASKNIYLNSDGYLRVGGKGTVISAATCPVFLDFGPGFLCKDGSFESRVAYVAEHRLMHDMLYLKVRWISHADLVKELNECPDKFFGSQAGCRVETTSSVPVETIDLAQQP